ncbi:hypothetical protein, partial [Paenibacillus massiliensis]
RRLEAEGMKRLFSGYVRLLTSVVDLIEKGLFTEAASLIPPHQPTQPGTLPRPANLISKTEVAYE